MRKLDSISKKYYRQFFTGLTATLGLDMETAIDGLIDCMLRNSLDDGEVTILCELHDITRKEFDERLQAHKDKKVSSKSPMFQSTINRWLEKLQAKNEPT